MSRTEKIILDVELRRLESLEAGIKTLTEKIVIEAVEEPRVRLLMGFTSIDYYSAMLLLAETGDVKRFSSPKKLVEYHRPLTGTCPIKIRLSGCFLRAIS